MEWIKKNQFWLWLGFLVLSLFAIYGQVINAPFLPWDDDYNLTKNPFIVNGPWTHLWQEPFYGMYVPITDTVWVILYKLGGGASWPFRLTSLLFHYFNTVMVYFLCSWIQEKYYKIPAWTPLVGALLFALHPLQVGSVAWVSDMRAILSTFFALLACFTFFAQHNLFARFLRKDNLWLNTFLSAALFALALLSKPQLAALPMALVIFCWVFTPDTRFTAILRLLPWFGISALAAYITHGAQVAVLEWQTPFWMRPLIMIDSFGFYIIKTIFPYALAVDYGRTPQHLRENLDLLLITGPAFAVVTAFFLWLGKRDVKSATFYLIWLTLLLPTSGIVDFGFQQISSVADHYCYSPMIIASIGFMLFAGRLFPAKVKESFILHLRAPMLGGILICFMILSFLRAMAWTSEQNFFTDMAEKNDHSYSAAIGLANILCMRPDKQDIEKGRMFAERATTLRADDPVSVADLAVCLIRQQRYADALALEKWFEKPGFVTHLKRHDFAASSLFLSIGALSFYLGKVDKGFLYVCEGVAANSINPGGREQLNQMMQALAAKGDHRSCPAAVGVEATIARAASFGPLGTP